MLHTEDSNWAPKAREAAGWVALWKDIGLYDMELEVPDDMPFGAIMEPWITVERLFRAALWDMGLKVGERILDIGAGLGWASHHFAMRGAHPVAIDVVADLRWGLGRAQRRMDAANIVYDLTIGDNERLPFQPESFDFVFASAALHHHDHLDLLCQNIYRVLKPGGRLIAIGEPIIPLYQHENEATDGDREKSFGIIERRHRFYHYVFAVWRAGLRNIHAEDEKTFWKNSDELYPWMDIERYAIEQHTVWGSKRVTKALTWLMLRLPRPFAVALLLSLRYHGTLMISAQKPRN
jgi:SAM-dependent methyltransferase